MARNEINLQQQMIMFLGAVYKSENGIEPYGRIDIDTFILSPRFYTYMIKKNLINEGQMMFRDHPIEIDYDEYADIWGMTGKREGVEKKNERKEI